MDFIDAEKRGKPIAGCRFYQKSCCTGDYFQFGPNEDFAAINLDANYKDRTQSVVCSANFQTWLFKAQDQEAKHGNHMMLDGTDKPDGLSCLAKSTWGAANNQITADWSNKLESVKVCEIDADRPNGIAHRRRRGVANCKSKGAAPQYTGWAWYHYPGTGPVCDFGGGAPTGDNRKQVSDAVQKGAISGCCDQKGTTAAYHASTLPTPVKGQTLGDSDEKYASFDTDLYQYVAKNETGFMHEWRGQILLEKDKKYKFALKSDAGSSLWIEGTQNPLIEWKGCHEISKGTFNEHESVEVTGDGEWHKINLYYAYYDAEGHMFLRVDKDGIIQSAEALNIRHNVQE